MGKAKKRSPPVQRPNSPTKASSTRRRDERTLGHRDSLHPPLQHRAASSGERSSRLASLFLREEWCECSDERRCFEARKSTAGGVDPDGIDDCSSESAGWAAGGVEAVLARAIYGCANQLTPPSGSWTPSQRQQFLSEQANVRTSAPP